MAKRSRLPEMARTGIAVPPPIAVRTSDGAPDRGGARICGDPLLWRRHVGDCPILVVSSP
jgi:hypothetical protein